MSPELELRFEGSLTIIPGHNSSNNSEGFVNDLGLFINGQQVGVARIGLQVGFAMIHEPLEFRRRRQDFPE